MPERNAPMGLDRLPPPAADEAAEITIEVEGAVDDKTFEEFKKQLRDCLARFARATQPRKTRWIRASIKKKQ